MDNSLDPNRPLLGQLLWSADPATQNAISLVLAAGVLALLLVYSPIIVRLIRLILLDRAVREACRLDDRPAEAHREEIGRAFSRSPIASQWEEFVSRWRGSLADGERQRAPVRLLDVFEDRPLVPTGAIKSLLPALPGLFLSFGVLGSFVGLTAAVGLGAGEGGAAGTALVAERVGLALRSGLWGLILAIAAVIGGRLLDGVFDRLAESLDRTVERAFGAVSAGELVSLSSRTQRDALVQLGGELKRFASELTERLDRGLQRIEHSTASAANLVSEEQRSVLQNVVRELSVQVQTGVADHLSSLQEVLERAIDHQGAVTGGLAEAFEQMAESAQVHAQVTEILEQSAFSVRDAASSMSSTAHDLTPILTHLREAGTAMAETASTMNATQEVVAQSADGIRGSIDHATAALFEQREFIETGLQEVRATLELMSSGLGENLNQALRNVDDALDHTVGRLRETIEHSNETIDRLSLPVRAAEGTTRETHSALERVRDEVVALGEWMSQAVRPLRGSLSQLEEHAGDITRALVQFGDHAVHVDKTMDALRGEIHQEGRRFRSSASELGRHLQTAADVAGTLRAAAPGTRPAAPPGGLPPPTSALSGARPARDPTRPPTGSLQPGESAGGPNDPMASTTPEALGTPHPATPMPGSSFEARATGSEPIESPLTAPRPADVIEPSDATPGSPVESSMRSQHADRVTPHAEATLKPAVMPAGPTSSAGPSAIETASPQAATQTATAAEPLRGTLPIRAHAEPDPSTAGSGQAANRVADARPVAPTAMAASPAAPTPGATPSTAKVPGPNPTTRGADSESSVDRQRRILESVRSMRRPRVEDPSGVLDEADELSLSGLLSKPGSSGSDAKTTRRRKKPREQGAVSQAKADPGPDEDESGSSRHASRPRTWKLLGKD